ncbi:MAG: response regulator [Actinobacteria bacterium]|nr:response regulator [Actinomycetota bacterium]
MSTILLVEDEPDIRHVVKLTLSSAGYDVIDVLAGEDALGYVGSVDLVLLDLRLPGIDGFGFLDAIGDPPPVPVVAMSAHAHREITERALERGCAGYLTKPFTGTELLEEVRRHLDD